MRRIINTFKYGSAYTKRILLMSIFLLLVTVGLVVCSVVFSNMLLFFAAVIALFAAQSVMQTLHIKEESDTEAEKPDYSGGITTEREQAYDGDKSLAESEQTYDGDKSLAEPEQTYDGDKSSAESEQAYDEILEDGENGVKKRHIKKKEKKEKKDSKVSDDEKASADGEIEINGNNIQQASVDDIEAYDRPKVRKTLRKYKVKRDHRMVMIDFCEKLHIKQSPAYIWIYKGEFHMLVIEKEPRHITVPLGRLMTISYLKKQPANPDLDYAAFKGNGVMAELFKPYLPDYLHSTVIDDLTAYKNLYGTGPEIYFTNRSAANLFDLLGVRFEVTDKVTESKKVNLYFKDAYKANILLRDNVIDANGYADRISDILDGMAHSDISYTSFKDTLNLMIKNKLITQEFAMYYMGVRDKIFG